jgi:hypothetical protein
MTADALRRRIAATEDFRDRKRSRILIDEVNPLKPRFRRSVMGSDDTTSGAPALSDNQARCGEI